MVLLPLHAHGEEQATITGYRIASNPGYIRMVIEGNTLLPHTRFTLENPDRVVIDVKNAKWSVTPTHISMGKDTGISKVRHGPKEKKGLRIVLDVIKPLAIWRSFSILPDDTSPSYRLVVDMVPKDAIAANEALPGTFIAITPVTKEDL